MPPSSASSSRRAPRGPGRPRREHGGAALRDALLDAATELAVERGFDAVGLRAIAERAGASPGMIAYYFGDREGLYEALFERAFARVSEQVETLLDADETGENDLAEVTRLHVTALSRDPWIPQLIAREVLARRTRLRETFAERVSDGPMAAMERWIGRGIAAGRLSPDLDPQLTAMSIAAVSVFPYLFGPVVGPRIGLVLDEEFRDRLIEHNERLISCGIRARPERPA